MSRRPSESTVRVGSAGDRRGSTLGLTLVVSHAGGVETAAVGRRAYAIGRDAQSDVRIDEPSVSRKHAVLDLDAMTLEDLGSMNGSKVGGERLRAGEPLPIAMGVLMEVGHVTLLLLPSQRLLSREALPPAPTAPPPSRDLPVIEDETTKRLYAMLDVIAPSPLSVLVLGETGVGKEV